MPSFAIDLENVSLSIHGHNILHELNFKVKEGEFVGLIGPNGVGKTTIFRLLLGLIRHNSGSVKILDTTPKAARKKIGYVPQFANFRRDFPMVVEEAVLSGSLSLNNWLGMYNSSSREQAQILMEKLGIYHLRLRPLARLSGGELQRVLLARALACNPKILLLDEPTTNVDNYREEEIFDLLAQLNPTPTILLISHDLGFITPKINRVACLNKTISMHTPEHLTPKSMEQLYGHPIHAVHHH